ncbi:CLUMA_CG019531, isoform B [Clunio marinus]|uniref:CLUMA_CG019531, isoform B n=1 Tax=Clunio marinus TaxID=568069 RepID=A0A1J1J7C7_9DIPT|nr:CLUMA_CG019531, isoform B [Clunio marinus]
MIYTAKSLYVEKSREIFNDAQLQDLSDVINQTIENEKKEVKEVPRISSIFNLNKLNLLPIRQYVESSEDDLHNEIERSDVIEIEVPVIGNEYIRDYQMNEDENKSEASDEVNSFDIITTSIVEDHSTHLKTEPANDISTFSNNFQTIQTDETTPKKVIEIATQAYDEAPTLTITSGVTTKQSEESNVEDIQSAESKLLEHIEEWKATESYDNDFPIVEKIFTLESRSKPKFPFNVKILVNNDDYQKSCKSKTSCNQVSYKRPSQLDQHFYSDYSDEDLLFQTDYDHRFELLNEKQRNVRRADDPLDFITPAPRFPTLPGFKKPNFIERLESESDLERAERVNKDLDNLMRFVSVWAQVDKFISDRARSALRRFTYVTGDDYYDMPIGSKKRSSLPSLDEPFT